MTDAGWAREKPTAPGWYWWRVEVSDLNIPNVRYCEKAVAIWETAAGLFVGGQGYLQDLGDGEWLGPITPDSYQQGRVAGLREAAKEVLRQATAIDAANKFNEMAEQLAQQAQDEKGVGDA